MNVAKGNEQDPLSGEIRASEGLVEGKMNLPRKAGVTGLPEGGIRVDVEGYIHDRVCGYMVELYRV